MIHPKVLFWFSVAFLCLLIAAPALAATVVCPSTCSCLLPAKAKELGYSGYCEGKQAICGYDAAKNPMYCYQKPTTTSPLIKPTVTTIKPTITITKTVTTTTTVPICPTGCLCILAEEAKAKGLVSCNGKQTLCGYDRSQTPMYCFSQPAETTMTTKPIPTTTTFSFSKVSPTPTTTVTVRSKDTPVPTETLRPIVFPVVERTPAIPDAVPCRANFSCLDEGTIRAKGFTIDRVQTDTCGYSGTKGVLYCAQSPDGSEIPAAPSDEGIVNAIVTFFMSIFGSPVQTAPAPQSTAYLDYCQARYGLDSCDGYCANLSDDEDHCGSCGTACYSDEICCSGTCVRSTSATNCGSCGTVCPDETVCQNGACDRYNVCYYGNSECSNVCVDLESDPQNCGSCGNTCPANARCVNGNCTPCPLNTLGCDGSCVFSNSDRENCGACRNVCSDDAICSDGSCFTCSGWTPTRCGEACANLLSDDDNCGVCGYACPNGTYCSGGGCECPGYEHGIQWCPTGLSGTVVCMDTMNDPDNCGGCTRTCAAGEICRNGECINIMNDPDNCGRYGNACGEDVSRGAGICRAGTCTFCDAGYYGCEAESGAVSCINLTTSPSNCGACGHSCAEGETCCNGVCSDLNHDDDACGACGNDCITQICCDGVCKDPLSDENNCGSCGNHCGRPDREHCIMGRCCNAVGTNCE